MIFGADAETPANSSRIQVPSAIAPSVILLIMPVIGIGPWTRARVICILARFADPTKAAEEAWRKASAGPSLTQVEGLHRRGRSLRIGRALRFFG